MNLDRLKKPLTILICVAILVTIIFLIANAPEFGREKTDETRYEDLTYSTDPLDETLEFIPYFTMATEPETYPTAVLGENVKVEQVPNPAGEEIDRTSAIGESHPEYLEADQYEPFLSVEGKVYRNNKVITLTVEDKSLAKTYDISFGHITGKCNRFLYLSPTVTSSGAVEDFYVWFEIPIGGGQTHNFNKTTDGEMGMCYTFQRALEDRTTAQYVNAQSPGVVWFTSNAIDRPVYVDAMIYTNTGRMVASVRITIEKDETDGTYSITDLDSNNLLDQNELYLEYTPDELSYIVNLTDETFFHSDKVSAGADYSNNEVTSEKCLIDIRPEKTGLLFDEFIPAPGGLRQVANYLNSGMDILAVTYRPTETISHTLYFYILCPPANGEHGVYQYIGRDYPSFATYDDLKFAGWKQHP